MEAVEFRPSKALLVIWLLPAVLLGLVAGGIGVSTGMGLAANRVTAVVAGLGFVVGFVGLAVPVVLHFYSIRYEINDRHVVKFAGVLWKVRRATPLEKITNIDVRQGPVETLLGIGQVWIFTPSTGMQMPEITLAGLTGAEQYKEMILARCEAVQSGESAAPAATSPARRDDETIALLREMADTLGRIEDKLGDRS